MPPELRAIQEQIAAGSTARDHRKAIRERLSAIAELFRIPRYRPHENGDARIADGMTGGAPARRDKARAEGGPSGGQGGSQDNLYSLFERPNPTLNTAAAAISGRRSWAGWGLDPMGGVAPES